MVKDSVEEKILILQDRKRNLANQLISTDESFFKSHTRDDIAALFSQGRNSKMRSKSLRGVRYLILGTILGIVLLSPALGNAAGRRHDDPAPYQPQVFNGKGFSVTASSNPHGGHLHEFLTIQIGKHVYRVPDERYSAREENGKRSFFNDDTEVNFDREYELSPDGNWLFVDRKCMHRVAVGYLYHRISATTMVAVHLKGLRLDEAGWRFVARQTTGRIASLNYAPLLKSGPPETFIADFGAWGPRSASLDLAFLTSIIAADGTDTEKMFTCRYDLRRHTFRLLKNETF
jgi:hypothetical protein